MNDFVVVVLANVHAIRIAKENEWEIGSYARLLLGNETTLNVLGIGIRFVEIIGGEHMTEIGGVLEMRMRWRFQSHHTVQSFSIHGVEYKGTSIVQRGITIVKNGFEQAKA